MLPPRVLVLATTHSYRLEPFLAAARKVGVEVIRGLDVPPALAGEGAGVLGLDFHSPERAVAQVQAHVLAGSRLAAVIPTDDAAVTLAAHIAEAIDLPHNAVEAAEATRDKRAMRRAFAEAGLPGPWVLPMTPADHPQALAARVAYPCVLKPACLSGSRGVIRADNADGFVAAFERLGAILARAGHQAALVEGYLPGDEYALEGILSHGALSVLALFDKPDPLIGPFFEETIYVTPSRAAPERQAAIARTVQAMAAAVGLREGAVHAEVRVNAAGVFPLEIAGRSIGGLCSQVLRFTHSAEVSLEELILRQALGHDVSALTREVQAGGVMMMPIPAAGTLAGIQGLEAAQAVPGIESVTVTAPLGYPLVPLPEGESYLGFIFARGAGPTEVEAALRAAWARLSFTIEPALPVLG
jgi:biotin carboxylase